MTTHDEHDDLMDVIRRARPDDLGSARTPAAQALLEEIMSMDVIHTAEVATMNSPGGYFFLPVRSK